MRKETDDVQFHFCILVCWALWYSRNRYVFEGQSLEAMEVINFVRDYNELLNHPSNLVLHPTQIEPQTSWSSPNIGVVKINFDASVNQHDGFVRLGIIARIRPGECVGVVIYVLGPIS